MSGSTYRYTSSLREAPIEQTLAHARRIAADVGIVRVTDTTRLDRIGLPVFASIRPQAVPGSLHVSAGKGFRREEAQVGAYMEAIELAFAEPGRAQVEIVQATIGDLLDGGAAEELCPLPGPPLRRDQPIACVVAVELRSGKEMLVPAEMVLFPPPRALVPRPIFGSDGNGLSSGNSVDEAVVHGLAEVMERDVMSFVNVLDDTRRIRHDTLSPHLGAWVDELESIGFDIALRHRDNEYRMPWVMAVIRERGSPEALHMGYGCNPSRDIAAARALAEAAQARLTVIHGARDDLPGFAMQLASKSPAERAAYYERVFARLASETSWIDFGDVPDHADTVDSVPGALAFLMARLDETGASKVLRVRYTQASLPLQVTKVIVPRLECNVGPISRIGPRLRAFIANLPLAREGRR